MTKRTFRRQRGRSAADYPTADEFQQNRRQFLAELGGVVLGAGALFGAGIVACSDDDKEHMSGAADSMVPRPDAGTPDAPVHAPGTAPIRPDAALDRTQRKEATMGIAPHDMTPPDRKPRVSEGVRLQPDAAKDR